MYLNKVMLYGNLTRDPEVKALPSGQQIANFSIATSRSFTSKDGKKEEVTEFHNVVAFGKQAEIIGQYVKKGAALYVEGRLQTRSWEKDGVKKYTTEIMTESFQFGARAADSKANAETMSAAVGEDINPEDIPF